MSSSTSRTASRSSRRCGNVDPSYAWCTTSTPSSGTSTSPSRSQRPGPARARRDAVGVPPRGVRRYLAVDRRRARADRRRPGRIHTITIGTEPVSEVGPEDPERMYLALSRFVPHKRIDVLLEIWDQVRPMTGGTLVIAGDGPERAHLERAAGDSVCSPASSPKRETASPRSSLAPPPPCAARGVGGRRDGGRVRRHAHDRLRCRRRARLGAARHDGTARRHDDPPSWSAGSISRRILTSANRSATARGHGRTSELGSRTIDQFLDVLHASVGDAATGRPRGS